MYRLDPNKKDFTPNEVVELMMYLISAVMRPADTGRNHIVLDEAFYQKLPKHLQQAFSKD